MRIQRFEEYNDELLTEGWLGDKLKQMGDGARAALKSFTAPFTQIFKNIKQGWKDGVKSEEIRKTIGELLKKSFDGIYKQLDKIENPDEIDQLFNNMQMSIVKLGDDLNKQIAGAVKESNSYDSINENENLKAAGAGVSAMMKTITGTFKKAADAYKDAVGQAKELQKKKKEAKDEFQTIQKTIEGNLKKLDIKGLMDKARQGNSAEGEYNPGDDITYKQISGEENTGTVAASQNDAAEGKIIVTTDNNPKGFPVDKESIIGKKEKDTEDVGSLKNKLASIKKDPEKIKKVLDFVDSLA
jgi:hypothetical protein